MQILVACEESQVVTKAFRAKGHHAWSCDTQPCSGGHPEWHFECSISDNVLDGANWDMIIAFPPCTHLASSGARYWKQKQANGLQQYGINFFMQFVSANCRKIAIENPVGIMSTVYRKPDQIIHPHWFGDPFMKKTCLWLQGLPELEPTKLVIPKYKWTSNSTRSGPDKNGKRKKSKLPVFKAWNSPKERSKTFPGIAQAMADQWG